MASRSSVLVRMMQGHHRGWGGAKYTCLCAFMCQRAGWPPTLSGCHCVEVHFNKWCLWRCVCYTLLRMTIWHCPTRMQYAQSGRRKSFNAAPLGALWQHRRCLRSRCRLQWLIVMCGWLLVLPMMALELVYELPWLPRCLGCKRIKRLPHTCVVSAGHVLNS